MSDYINEALVSLLLAGNKNVNVFAGMPLLVGALGPGHLAPSH